MEVPVKSLIHKFISAFKTQQKACFTTAKAAGWHVSTQHKAVELALIHAEVSEAVEALRRGDPVSCHLPDFSSVEEELADVVMRIMTLAETHGYRVAEAIVAKTKFNKTREYRHGGKLF